MKTTTTNFNNLINNGFPYHYVNLYLDSVKLDVTFKSFNYYGLINSGEGITIGSTCASYIEFELYNQTVSLENEEVQVKVGIDVNGAIENVSLGFFTITKPINTDEISKYTAYDRMIKLEKLYASSLTNPTVKSIMNEIGTQTGYGFKDTLTNDINIDALKIKGYTYREIIGYLSALYGANCVINDVGQIEFKIYKNSNIAIGRNKIYENGLELLSDNIFKIEYLKCATGESVEHTSTDEEGEEVTDTEDVILSVGSGNTGISISNPFMTQEVLEYIYNTYLKNLSYRPCKVNMIGDITIECGDIVSVNDGVNTYNVPVMNLKHSIDGGITTNIEAVSQTESEQEINYTGPTIKYVERVYSELIEANEILASKIQASNITTDYLETHYAKIDLANIKEACITTAMIGAEVVGTSQIANSSITDAKIVELTANKITAGTLSCDRLLINGSDKSLVYYLNNMGDLTYSEVDTINAGVLTERSITADKIVAKAITSNEIASKTITANEIKVGTITANEIASNTITSAEINVSQLFAQDITATGTISGLTLKGVKFEASNDIAFLLNGTQVAKINAKQDSNSGILQIYGEKGVYLYTSSNNYPITLDSKYVEIGNSTKKISISESYPITITSNKGLNINCETNISSTLDATTIYEGGTSLSSKYASYSHTHSGYASSSHTHSGYASSSHTHSGYLSSGGTLSGALYLGSSSYYINGNGNGVFNKVTTDNFEASGTNFLVNSNGNIRIGGTSSPSSSNAIFTYWKDGSSHNLLERNSNGLTTALGWAGSTSYKSIVNLRSQTIQCNGSTSWASDENIKKDFNEFDNRYESFYDNLKPITYKYINGTGDRFHSGFKTQDVEQALEEANLTTKDFAGVVITPIEREVEVDDNGNEVDIPLSNANYLLDMGINEQHNLAYVEFIALNTWQIQKLKATVKEQQRQINELKDLVNKLINK